MSKKKRPSKLVPPSSEPVPQPVLHGNAFVAFVNESISIIKEIEARRAFGTDVVEYLTLKNLLSEWSAWREAKHAPKKPE